MGSVEWARIGAPSSAHHDEVAVAETPPAPAIRSAIVEGRHCARREDLLKARVGLRPKSGAPRGVQGINAGVTFGQPGTKRAGAGLAETFVNVAAVLIADMPHHHARMVSETPREGVRERAAALAQVGRG